MHIHTFLPNLKWFFWRSAYCTSGFRFMYSLLALQGLIFQPYYPSKYTSPQFFQQLLYQLWPGLASGSLSQAVFFRIVTPLPFSNTSTYGAYQLYSTCSRFRCCVTYFSSRIQENCLSYFQQPIFLLQIWMFLFLTQLAMAQSRFVFTSVSLDFLTMFSNSRATPQPESSSSSYFFSLHRGQGYWGQNWVPLLDRLSLIRYLLSDMVPRYLTMFLISCWGSLDSRREGLCLFWAQRRKVRIRLDSGLDYLEITRCLWLTYWCGMLTSFLPCSDIPVRNLPMNNRLAILGLDTQFFIGTNYFYI